MPRLLWTYALGVVLQSGELQEDTVLCPNGSTDALDPESIYAGYRPTLKAASYSEAAQAWLKPALNRPDGADQVSGLTSL
jgi:hypothetical protein